MNKIALIPARYQATRFPGKLMQPLGTKSVIRRTYEAALATALFDQVVVATDSEVIFQEIVSHGGHAVMSKKNHESGTDRIAEAAETIVADLILNIQGDTPFVKKEPLQKLLQQFDDETVQVASLMQVITDPKDIHDPNFVKVAIDQRHNALFFSRSVLPYPRNPESAIVYYEHIGVYAFRRQALLDFSSWPVTPLENIEKIECLRYLEHGVPLRMVVVDYMGVEIDTPEDLARATKLL